MIRFLAVAAGIAWFLGVGDLFAAERTIRLKVNNMTCVTCPYIVRASLAEISGVGEVEVSFSDETAVVTYEDSKVNLAALMAATARFGFPSQLAGPADRD